MTHRAHPPGSTSTALKTRLVLGNQDKVASSCSKKHLRKSARVLFQTLSMLISTLLGPCITRHVISRGKGVRVVEVLGKRKFKSKVMHFTVSEQRGQISCTLIGSHHQVVCDHGNPPETAQVKQLFSDQLFTFHQTAANCLNSGEIFWTKAPCSAPLTSWLCGRQQGWWSTEDNNDLKTLNCQSDPEPDCGAATRRDARRNPTFHSDRCFRLGLPSLFTNKTW